MIYTHIQNAFLVALLRP